MKSGFHPRDSTGDEILLSLSVEMKRYARSVSQWSLRPPRVQIQRHLRRMGSDYGGYFIDTSMLRSDSVVYSLGIGEDISFDLALIEELGCVVQAFDPTPKVKSWLESQKIPIEFRFHSFGVADFDGEVNFYQPPRQDFISHSIVHARQFSSSSIRVPVAKLSTIMTQLDHRYIDLLKIDIEGSEYGVIEQIVAQKMDVRQLAVEFHHRLSGIEVSKTRKALEALYEYGMRICHICPRLEVVTLVRDVG